jgi:hypothetical protein
MNEFKDRFAVFGRSDRRLRLYDRIEELISEAFTTDLIDRILIAGSYVSAKPEPNDFDCLLVLSQSATSRELRPFEYRLISQRMARRVFGGDVITAIAGSPACTQMFDFFQKTRSGAETGIVEIVR